MMEPAAPGTHIIIANPEPWDDASRGQELIVRHVDPSDNTFRGEDVKTGKLSGWIHWRQAEPANPSIGWDFLESVLPRDTIELLSAFDGLKQLTLKPEVATRIIRSLPDIESLIRFAVRVPPPGAGLAPRPMRPSRFPRSFSGASDFSAFVEHVEKFGRTPSGVSGEPQSSPPSNPPESSPPELRSQTAAKQGDAPPGLTDEELAGVEDLSHHLA